MSTISENDIKSIPELNTKLESNGLFAITINRPEKANAFTIEVVKLVIINCYHLFMFLPFYFDTFFY